MTDGREHRKLHELQSELEAFFHNEVVDERLEGLSLTGIELSSDRKHLTLRYLPVEGRDESAQEGLQHILALVRERAREVLFRAPEIRFKLDRGAQNRQRVERILRELADEQEHEQERD
ncbi:MAG: ribosome-binding factor A [Planctomycetota bacterium]